MNELLFLVVFPYFIFSFGCCEKPLFASWFKKHDLSYGMYLWGFPVQQTLVFFFHNSLSYTEYLVLTIAIVIILSYISFVYVENPMIYYGKKIVTNI